MAKLRYEVYVPRAEKGPSASRGGTSTVRADIRPTPAEIDAAIRRLPALPALLHELMRELRDADADIRHLEERIASDASLTTRVLKMANSPFYARSGEVVDVRRAVMTLGFRTVANLVMAAGLRNTMAKVANVPTFAHNGIFMHCLASGLACTRLVRIAPSLREVADELFVAGLLHDVGRIALSDFYVRASAEIMARPATALDPVNEFDTLGVDHQAVGGLVQERWGLPEDLLGAITRHHAPVEEIRDEPVILAVALIDAVLDHHGYARTVRNERAKDRVQSIGEVLGVDPDAALGLLAAVEEEVTSIAGSFA